MFDKMRNGNVVNEYHNTNETERQSEAEGETNLKKHLKNERNNSCNAFHEVMYIIEK